MPFTLQRFNMINNITIMNHTIYAPNDRRHLGLYKTLKIICNNLFSHRQMIFKLFLRDFTATHRKSFFGSAWIILAPILGMTTWIFMNSAGVLKPGQTDVPYPAYLLIGTSIWGLFIGFYQAAANTLTGGVGFILQVKYPHEILLAKQALEQLANFTIGLILNLAILRYFNVSLSARVLMLPISILPIFFLAASIGLFVSVFSALASEFKKSMDLLLGMLLYVTPVIFSIQNENPLLKKVIEINPLTYLICGSRDLILTGKINNLSAFLGVSAFSLILFIFSLRFFFISENRVIEKML
jgi:lipopolysaccharide transport system permease protein